METKSEMINRIAELAKENAELKAYKDVNEDFKTAWEELKAENERLKQQFAEFIKSISHPVLLPDVPIEVTNKYRQTLQEIKEISEHEMKELTDSAVNGGRYLEILQLITKTEEE